MSNDLKELARFGASTAKKAGAGDARVHAFRSREVKVEWRDGKLDRIRESTRQGLSITLYVEGRYSANNTSDLRRDALASYIRESVESTRYLAQDEHRRLPPPERYEGVTDTDLGLVDPAAGSATPEDRLQRARRLEEAVRGGKGSEQIISVTTSVTESESQSAIHCTNGFEAGREATTFVQTARASVKDEGDRKPSASAYGYTRRLEEMPAPDVLGSEALSRALAECGSRQAATGTYDIILENRCAPDFMRHLVHPLSGSAIQQKSSFLGDKLNKQIGAKLLSITDNPHLPGGLNSQAWDGEGMATRPRLLIDRGVLKFFYLDTYYGSKLEMEPTTGGASNLTWDLGKKPGRELARGMAEGIYVTSFLGGNSNPTTGDFSLGIKGFYVKDGKFVHPVSEMNIAGNHLKIWHRLADLGNDPFPYSTNRAPALLFTGVSCSGKS